MIWKVRHRVITCWISGRVPSNQELQLFLVSKMIHLKHHPGLHSLINLPSSCLHPHSNGSHRVKASLNKFDVVVSAIARRPRSPCKWQVSVIHLQLNVQLSCAAFIVEGKPLCRSWWWFAWHSLILHVYDFIQTAELPAAADLRPNTERTTIYP